MVVDKGTYSSSVAHVLCTGGCDQFWIKELNVASAFSHDFVFVYNSYFRLLNKSWNCRRPLRYTQDYSRRM